jgi:hypothetical protein
MSPEVEELVRLVCSFVADKAVNEPLRYQQWNDVETENIRNDFVTTEVKCRQIFFGAESQTDEKFVTSLSIGLPISHSNA